MTKAALNDPQQATLSYEQGIQLAQDYKQTSIIRLAHLKLNRLIQSQPQLEASANEIRGKLIEAQNSLEGGE